MEKDAIYDLRLFVAVCTDAISEFAYMHQNVHTEIGIVTLEFGMKSTRSFFPKGVDFEIKFLEFDPWASLHISESRRQKKILVHAFDVSPKVTKWMKDLDEIFQYFFLDHYVERNS